MEQSGMLVGIGQVKGQMPGHLVWTQPRRRRSKCEVEIKVTGENVA